MLGDGALGFREFAMREPLPLARIHQAILEFLRDRDDAVLFGAQAVNAYVEEPRMTQDVDILSPRAAELAEELRQHLAGLLRIATRTRQVGRGWRIFQVAKPKTRHLADVRPAAPLPPANRIGRILVVTPPELIAEKVIAYQKRKGRPKSGTDWRDLAELLLAFPDLKKHEGPVTERLHAMQADGDALNAWRDLVSMELLPEDDQGY